MPHEAANIIHENLEWTTLVSIIPKVQAAYPQVTGKQVHWAWTEMSLVEAQSHATPLCMIAIGV